MRSIRLIALAGLVAIAGCKADKPPDCPACAHAKLKNQWCEAHSVGYVAGVPIKSKTLFDTLDAHGHDVDIRTIKCANCQALIPKDGFCERCRVGWVRRQAYFSRLTYHLAKGTPCEPSAVTCPTCRKNAERHGWCDKCGVGMIGNVAIVSRADFDGGCRGYDLMMAAVELSKRCETCALACLYDRTCFVCKIPYKDGKALAKAGPEQSRSGAFATSAPTTPRTRAG